MTKTKRVLSVIIAMIIAVSMLSAFSVTSALSPDEIALKEAAELNKFIYNPFDAVDNPGYGATVTASNLVFVDNQWADVANGAYVYLEYIIGGQKEVYRAIKGTNAFSSPVEAVQKVGRENLNIKVGAGTYEDGFGAAPNNFEYNGLKFYGNYAGVNPNVANPDDQYSKLLNPEREASLESNIKATWTWETGRYNITLDGFTVSKHLTCFVSSQHVGEIYIYNCIFNGDYVMTAGGGYTDTLYFVNNRVSTNSSSPCFTFGGANSDVHIDDNYFEGCNSGIVYVNAVGNKTGAPALVSFSRNLVKNCKNAVRFEYSNANYGINIAFNQVEDNIFVGCTGAYTVGAWFYVDAVSGTSIATIVDPTSRTYVNRNTFVNHPANTPAINFIGRESLSGKDVKFVISANYNKFLFKDPKAEGNVAFDSSALGVVDASYNYYNVADINKIFLVDTELSSVITMPYYEDAALTRLVAAGNIQWQTRIIDRYFNPDPATYGLNEKKNLLYAEALPNAETVTVDNKVLISGESTLQLYYDFMLRRPVENNVLPLAGDKTLAYLVITNPKTGQSSKFGFTVNATTDKTKAEFIALYDKATDKPYPNYTVNGNDVNITLDKTQINFPFYILTSPSSEVAYYTDAACTKPYTDDTYYMTPGTTTVVYAKIVSGDKSNTKIMKLNFYRQGDAIADAAVEFPVTPLENIKIFTTRKTITYRPSALITSAAFDFKVSEGATYAIYSDKACTKLVSKEGDVKELPIGDGIVYYYVKVSNPAGFETVYTLVTYNDVKSTDNEIKGIYGITEGITFENNVITVEASTTLALINARFDTNPFADVVVYGDANKTFKVDPSVTYEMVNNREVEVRTFQLGITNKVSYFWVDVTSETGVKNSYRVIIYKKAQTTEFTDIGSHWGKKYIQDVANLGIVNGYAKKGKYEFRPNNNASRQEVAVLLCRMLGIEQHAFRNVALSYEDAASIPEWSYNYVKAAYALKFMVGSNNKFNGEANITREEFFKAIAGVLNLDTKAAASVDLGKFKDGAKVANWAVGATKACIKAGLVEGSGGYLNPKANITRAEIAKIVSMCTTIRNDVRYE